MKGYQPMDSFGQETADIYDAELRGDEATAVALLRQLAGGGPALELAVGTGRIALPLAATGLRVDGIDLSPAMVAKLRAKPGGGALNITLGDFADVPVEGAYQLIFIVFNSLFNLFTQDDQVRCFENVARHDPVSQRLDESHVVLSSAGVRLFPVVTRYAWPAELDLMARIAGLRLTDRWGGWDRRPFTATSRNHVSVYGR